MVKVKAVVAPDEKELCRALGLSSADAVEMRVRRRLNDKIIQAVRASRLTRPQAAKAARTSRTRLTAILNRNTTHVSIDLMLRILLALGYRPTISFTRIPRAA